MSPSPAFWQKTVLAIYCLDLLLHALFIHFNLPYIAFTKPLIVPLLLTYLLLRDSYVGQTVGKFVFYVGLFLSLFGDVLLLSVTDTFFLSAMVIFMMVNLCYAFAFFQLGNWRRNLVVMLIAAGVLGLIGGYFMYEMNDDLGAYAMPVVVYIFTLVLMVLGAVSIATGSPQIRRIAWSNFIPGAILFMIEDMIFALNYFHYHGYNDLYIGVIIGYGTAQFLFVRGIEKVFLRDK